MLTIVWLVLGVGALVLLSVLAYGLVGQANRFQMALRRADATVRPQADELNRAIHRAQELRRQVGNGLPGERGRQAVR